jgi:hypothetical protein
LQGQRVFKAGDDLHHRKRETFYEHDAIFGRVHALQAKLPSSAAAARKNLAG